jgi:hypothetical protein
MLRQLAFVMRAASALWSAVQLGVADILAAGPMTSGELAATQQVMRLERGRCDSKSVYQRLSVET